MGGPAGRSPEAKSKRKSVRRAALTGGVQLDMKDGGTAQHDFRIVVLLSIGFGLVGLDRFIINPLFPVIAEDLGLDYQDIGLVAAVLALTWGGAAVVFGRLADRVGVKSVLVTSALAFSALVGLTGFAGGLGGLLAIRALLGVAEGTFVPASIVAASRASKPSRVGLNIGILHMTAALFGLGLAPLLATQLLKVLPSWHWVFVAVAIPGFLLAFCIGRVLKSEARSAHPIALPDRRHSWREVLFDRRVASNAIALGAWLAVLTTLGALLPSYLTGPLQLGLDQMGLVLSGLGLGGVVGMIVIPGLGDRFAHGPVAIGAVTVKMMALAALIFAPANVGLLFGLVSVVGLTGAGLMALTVGPLTGSAVAAPLAVTATGIVVGCGEILGGAIAPAAAGLLGARLGIGVVPVFALGAAAIGLVALGAGGYRLEWPSRPPAAAA
jgi:MFS family permease